MDEAEVPEEGGSHFCLYVFLVISDSWTRLREAEVTEETGRRRKGGDACCLCVLLVTPDSLTGLREVECINR